MNSNVSYIPAKRVDPGMNVGIYGKRLYGYIM